jgi:hypothetical protein
MGAIKNAIREARSSVIADVSYGCSWPIADHPETTKNEQAVDRPEYAS